MLEKAKEIMQKMQPIKYGYKDESGHNLLEEDWDFSDYQLLEPEELLEKQYGVCWDQVELERKFFLEENIPIKTYFIYMVEQDSLPSHTFLTFQEENKCYWFEHSWGEYQGIHAYLSEKELLLDVRDKFRKSHSYVSSSAFLFIYEYEKPHKHISCSDFYKYIETQKLIKLNSPLYFYHLVDKDADLSKGLLSLKYMYTHGLYSLFDVFVSKYKERITKYWEIDKFKNKEYLSREDYLEALTLFRGEYGTSYIYFFRYPPYLFLGKKIEELSLYKDIYRININDEEIQKYMVDIFYGYKDSFSENEILDKKYYENVSREEYFSTYDDSLVMNFSRLNHISIAFVDDFCPMSFLEKVEWEQE